MTVRPMNARARAAALNLAIATVLAQAAVSQASDIGAPEETSASGSAGTGAASRPIRLASASSLITFNLPPQPLAQSLRDVGSATNTNILFDPPLVRNLQAPELRAEITTGEALTRLLAGTGISHEFVNDSTVIVGASDAKLARLAQAESSGKADSPSSDDRDEGAVTELSEVVVTAQKREERLQDVPISMTVMGGAALEQSTALGVTELLTRVPSVSITESFQAGGAQITMRGVPPAGLSEGGSTPVAYYLDTVPFAFVNHPFTPDANAYDLDRVEVLRGPQGTLYGAAALSGVVRVLTKEADLDEFEFKSRALISGTRYGGLNYRGDMAVNAPIVEGKFAARAAISYQDMSGWIHRPEDDGANGARIGTYRFKLNAHPTDALTIGLSAWFSRSDVGGPSISATGHFRPGEIDEPIDTDYDVYGLKLAYDFGAFTVESATSYLGFAIDSLLDLTAVGAPGATLSDDIRARTFSEEVNFRSAREGAWQWSAGGIYRRGKDVQYQELSGLSDPNDYRQDSKSFAVFGELTRLALDGRLELTAGLRYFEDRLESDEVSDFTGIALGPYASTKFTATTPRLVLTWKPGARQTVYASYGEGFRSGLNNNGRALRTIPSLKPVEPDKLRNYELGAKTCLGSCRLQLDAAVYYMDWLDTHIQTLIPGLVAGTSAVAMVNGESASGVGIDLGMSAEIVDGLTLGASVGWNDLTTDADVLSEGVVLLQKGSRLNYSPETTLSASMGYVFPMGSAGYKGRFSASANYVSKYHQMTTSDRVVVSLETDDIVIGRASLALEAPRGWTASLFVDNLNNEQGAVSVFADSPEWTGRPRPRTIGLQFDFRR